MSYDVLIEIENFVVYMEYIKYLFDDSVKNNFNLLMMMFDIDYFKYVNDMYGYFVGDCVL